MINKTNEELNELMNFLKNTYEEKQILGLFLYDFIDFSEKPKVVVFYIPTFEELCIDSNLSSWCFNHNGIEVTMNTIKHIRNLSSSYKRYSIFSQNFILNEKYKKIFYKNIEILFNFYKSDMIRDIINNGLECLKEYERTKKRKNIRDAYKLQIICDLLLRGENYNKCLYPEQENSYKYYLDGIEEGSAPFKVEDIKEKFDSYKKMTWDIENDYSDSDIDNFIIELIRESLKDTPEVKEFMETLTKTEKEALDIIIEQLEGKEEGYISITSLVDNSTISRPVFKNTLQKMSNKEIAKVDNKGVKGTYIKLNSSIDNFKK